MKLFVLMLTILRMLYLKSLIDKLNGYVDSE